MSEHAGAAANDGQLLPSQVYLLREDEQWELTWPIWHMLPHTERKELAQKHGYATIGAFEEFMTLQRAVGDSSTAVRPIGDHLVYPPTMTQRRNGEEEEGAADGDDDESVLEAERELGKMIVGNEDAALRTSEMMDHGGEILVLPDEMLYRIFSFLPVDAYATLAYVSPHWKSFTRTEAVYKFLCERLYLNQSKRRVLRVAKFNNSYRLMLERRPRVRAGGGVYVMKYTRVKKIQRDMWTEVPLGAILEMVYYRYLYFMENGQVLYSLSATPPHEMFPRFRKVYANGYGCSGENVGKEHVVWGYFTVQGKEVTVEAKQSWQYVRLKLDIDLDSAQLNGRFGWLTFVEHVSSPSGDFDAANCVNYDVPSEPFRFVKDRRL